MKLVHFTTRKIKGPLRSVDPYPKLDGTKERLPIGKPRGFWVSVEGNGDGWSDWCEVEGFATDRFKHAYEVTLTKDAKIKWLKSGQDIDQFTETYHDAKNEVNKILSPIGPTPNTMYIDWGKLAREGYQGIIITPYIYSRRLGLHCTWYYGWDCASGCIWDTKAIKQLKKLPK